MYQNLKGKSSHKGFTLVELLIVVIILAILAAIVVPQFAASTNDARSSAADTNLANLRAAIDLYFQQHGEYPASIASAPTAACAGTDGNGLLNTEAAFLQQLSRYTDDDGGTCSIGDTTNHRFGPYMKKSTLPAEPFSNVATVEVVSAGDLNMLANTTPVGGPGGYKYDSVTGKIIINLLAEQDR